MSKIKIAAKRFVMGTKNVVTKKVPREVVQKTRVYQAKAPARNEIIPDEGTPQRTSGGRVRNR